MVLAVAIIVSASLAFAGTFSEWQFSIFTTEELADPATSGPVADPDEDGRANLLEYAFGLDPFLPDADESALNIGPESLIFTHWEAIGADDLVYRLESSSDLQQWGWITPNPAHREVLSENEGFRLISLYSPNPPGDRLFVRLRVEIGEAQEWLCEPTSLYAALVNPFQISIGWNDNAWVETGFSVERREGDGAWEEIGWTGTDENSFADRNFAFNMQYTYRTRALQWGFGSNYTNEFTLSTPVDTDGDGIPDVWEATYNTDPLINDTDGDGLRDGWKVRYGLNPEKTGDAETDIDWDGLSNGEELQIGTDLTNPDTDGDGGMDGAEGWPLHPQLAPPRLSAVQYAVIDLGEGPPTQ